MSSQMVIPELEAVELLDFDRLAGLEVTRFVKYVVEGEQDFRIIHHYPAILNQRCRVRHGFAVRRVGAPHVAHQRRDGRKQVNQPREFSSPT